MSTHNSSIQSSISSLLSLRKILEQIETDDYQKGIEKYEYNSIGSHVRHILEFYQQLLQGIQSSVVNYDDRQRNMSLEESTEVAIGYLDTVIEALQTLPEHIDLEVESAAFSGESPQKIKSNLTRELLYLIEHNTHHMALMRYMMKDYVTDMRLDDEFGYAHSTVKHLNNKTS